MLNKIIDKYYKRKRRKARKIILEELSGMPKEELLAELEKHKNGDLAKILIETKALEACVLDNNARKTKQMIYNDILEIKKLFKVKVKVTYGYSELFIEIDSFDVNEDIEYQKYTYNLRTKYYAESPFSIYFSVRESISKDDFKHLIEE